MRNALSVDVEDWFQVGAFEKVIDKGDWPRLESRVARNTDAVLDLFARAGVKATFFTLGWVAERAPAQMRRIVAEGHEIASHGWDHDRVFTLTPEQFRARMVQMWTGSCANAVAGPATRAVENGYPIAFWMMSCPLNKETGKPETTWFKAIAGRDSFYVVQKAFKFEPSQDQVAQWTRYLKQVAVCDTRLAARACPPGLR